MKQNKFAYSFAWIAALLFAAPATAQLINHPVQALPAGDGDAATVLATQYARGLNDNSGKYSSFGLGIGRTSEKVSYMAMGGYAMDYPLADNNELSLGGNIAYHMLSDDSTPVQVSAQVGLGWASIADEAVWNFPVGIALQARPSGGATSVTPWVMPRLDITRVLGTTSTDFAAAAGVGITTQSGAGAHLALDWRNVEGGSPFGLALGVHYTIN